MLECVINISEGRRRAIVDAIADAAGRDLLDVHSCPFHNRSVLTVVGIDAPRSIARATVDLLDLQTHDGVHPRIGVLDVVPFVALDGSSDTDALAARDAFADWIVAELAVPVFLYGPERTLPEVRRSAFTDLLPDVGGPLPHRTAGAVAVGVRPALVAWNLWLDTDDLDQARSVARTLRGPGVRALGLRVGDQVQVSCNLIDPDRVGPAEVWDLVAPLAPIARAELVGLVPTSVLQATSPSRWDLLDLAPDRTIEERLRRRGA